MGSLTFFKNDLAEMATIGHGSDYFFLNPIYISFIWYQNFTPESPGTIFFKHFLMFFVQKIGNLLIFSIFCIQKRKFFIFSAFYMN